MKQSKKIIMCLVIGMLCACDDDQNELLDPNSIVIENFFKSSQELDSSVTAIYTFLQDVGNYGRYQFYINDNIAGENYAAGNLEPDKVQMINRDVDQANNGNNQYWQHNYQGIGRANFVIVNRDVISGVSPTEVAQRLGEAHFLRALFYFNLINKYEQITLPVDTKFVAGGLPLVSREAVFDLIVEDLKIASRDLPAKGAQEVGRATSGAAWALLGKVYLQMGDKAAEAKDALSNVTGYSLMPNYRDNFTVEGEHNEESIFEVNYDESTGQGDSWNQDGRGNSETTFRAQEYSGWYNVKPSQELLDEFEDGDTRFSDSFYSIDDSNNGTMTNTFNNGMITFIAVADDTDPNDNFISINLDDNPSWRKYQNLDNRPSETVNSGINARVLRYADVLLMQAEAEIRSGGSESVALGFLNQVRSRPSVSMPLVNVTGTVAILDAIKHERWVELAGEQSRYLDLQRFDGFDYKMPIPNIERQSNSNIE